MNQPICILGSTGSIGTQALDVCKAHNVSVCGLAAFQNAKLLAEQTRNWKPKKICIYKKELYGELRALLSDVEVEILTGLEGLCELATMSEAKVVLNSVVGMIGLQPTLAAISAHKIIALANKETLVTGGELVIEAAKKHKVPILPIDSEHSAIFQALQASPDAKISRILLTASGGPFYGKTKEELQDVTVEDALNHPNWSMGAKITIDSATMMNKGLELMEAMWLFHLPPEQIEIIIHRESIVHSAVEFCDHSIIAQMGVPDMRLPIQYALTYPARLPSRVPALSFRDHPTLTFGQPDPDTFVCLKACIEAAKAGGLAPTAVNGANEQAVQLFLEKKIKFLEIGALVCSVLRQVKPVEHWTVEDILQTDRWARDYVTQQVNS